MCRAPCEKRSGHFSEIKHCGDCPKINEMNWTDAENKATISELLDFYAVLLSEFSAFISERLDGADTDLQEKLKTLQTLKSVATTIDFLLKRWSFAYRGYDGNSHQAREDAQAVVAERESLAESETVGNFHAGDDTGAQELNIILRALPDMEETKPTVPPSSKKQEDRATVNGSGHNPDGASVEEVPIVAPSVAVKKTKNAVVGEVFNALEAGEQTTAAIAGAIGRSQRSVRRYLAELVSDGKVSVVKRGVYRLSRSVKWTQADNEMLINEVLAVYTALIDACKADVKKIFTDEDISNTEKIRCVKSFNACVAMIDRLMKRWALVHQGWHTNPRLAKADVDAKIHHAEKVDWLSAPLASFFLVAGGYDSRARELIFMIPSPDPPSDETGTWSYDARTQELFPPGSSTPISEAEARRRLINRKSTRLAPLLLFR